MAASGFRGIDPGGLHAIAFELGQTASLIGSKAREAHGELLAGRWPVTAGAVLAQLTASASWCDERVTELSWRANTIDAGQRAVFPTGSPGLAQWLLEVEGARFAAYEPLGGIDPDEQFTTWFDESYGDGYGHGDDADDLAVLVTLMGEYDRLSAKIDEADLAGMPDSTLSEIERERHRVLEMIQELTGSAVIPRTSVIPANDSASGPDGPLRVGNDYIGTDPVESRSRSTSYGAEEDDDLADLTFVVREWGFEKGDAVAGWTFASIPGTAQVNLIGYETGGSVKVGFGDDGLELDVEGTASVYLVEVEYEASLGPIEAGLEAQIGAEASGEASVQIDPLDGDLELEVALEAFAGASAEAQAVMETRYASAGGGVRAHAGIGAGANAEVGFEDGKFSFDVGADVALGVGLGFDVEFEVDVPQIASDVVDAAQHLYDATGLDTAVDLAGDAGSALVDGAVDAGEFLWKNKNPLNWG